MTRLTGSAIALLVLLSGCTRGHLSYIDSEGNKQTGCEAEYTWAPSVDRHAVDYWLYHCAKKALDKGYQVLNDDILVEPPALPIHPEGKLWTWDEATRVYHAGHLTDQQYGYLIAAIDLNHIGSQTADN